MITYAEGLNAYQLSSLSGQTDFFVWIALFLVWAVSTTRAKPAPAATPEEQEHAERLARKRFRRITAACAAVAVLWPVLGFGVVYCACPTGTCW